MVVSIFDNLTSQHYQPVNVDLELANDCARFHNDPLGWVLWAFDWGHNELKGRHGPEDWQREFLQDWGDWLCANPFDGVLPVGPFRTATKSGHGIGKSALVSWIILFILSTRPKSKGVVTANTGDQLRTKTWAELAKWKALCLTGHWFEQNATSLQHRAWPEDWRVDAQTCREENSESFAGLHAATSSPFYIFDEASAVPDKIWEVAEGGLTDGQSFFFAFGNPTRSSGAFYEKFGNSYWRNITVDSRTVAHTNKEVFRQWAEMWGEDSDFFRVRVKGEFPRAGDMQFIPTDLVVEARRRGPGRYLGTDPLVCGIDMARGGEDSCYIVFRRGKDAKSEKTYQIPGERARDSMQVVSKLMLLLNDHKPDHIFIDATGIGGPVADRLRQLGYSVVDVNFGGKADDDRHFRNKTAEMGYRLRQWLTDGGAIPDDGKLEKELTTRLFWHDKDGRLVVEPKDEGKEHQGMKKRLGFSPDWGDALYLTFAHEVPSLMFERGSRDVAPHARDYVAQQQARRHPLDRV